MAIAILIYFTFAFNQITIRGNVNRIRPRFKDASRPGIAGDEDKPAIAIKREIMRKALLFCSLFTFACLIGGPADAAKSHSESGVESRNCFDATDRRDIRLWDGPAPGAIGDDPCRDIPYLRVFPAEGAKDGTTAAILVVPGGGYDRLTNTKEQDPVGNYFAKDLHAATFVLYYRLVQADGSYRYPVPMWDGQRALKLIRARAHELGIDPNRIGAFGFSAGGHLATTLAEHSSSDFELTKHDAIDALSGRLDFLGLGYPVISMEPDQFGKTASHDHLLEGYHGHELDKLEHYLSGQDNVAPHTPPVFLFVSMDDRRIDPQNSVLLSQALKSAGISSDVHLFAHGAHGVGLAQDVPDEQVWPDLFQKWLKSQRVID